MARQAGSIGRKARQKVEVEQRDWKYSGKQEAPSATPVQTTKEAGKITIRISEKATRNHAYY